ncbi:MAG: hypothetical protein FWD90_07260 [Defluviitaleaceae bacterium]|nr:hypothetical protein [Defluviitaleaceae bacterium]
MIKKRNFAIYVCVVILLYGVGIYFMMRPNEKPPADIPPAETPEKPNGEPVLNLSTSPPTPPRPRSEVGDYYLYVCTTGSDTNDGSKENPFATVQRAVSVANANRNKGNQTVYIREGIYFQQFMISGSYCDDTGRDRLEGEEPAFLTVRNYPGETAVLDGSLNEAGEFGQPQMIIIRDSDYVRIYGLVIQNNAPVNFGFSTPAAVLVETSNPNGRSQGVEIINNTILGMDGDTFGYPTPSAPGANGSAIQVYGRAHREENALRYLLIEGNEVAYNRVGWTENIVVAGNVADFTVRNNYVHNNNNIGINVIGLWGWITGTGTSANARADWNRARRGIVEGNVVINNIGYGNHAYEGCGGASGIYVDGAMDITIRYNFVSGSSCGISVGTEPSHARWDGPEPVMAENIRIYHNIIANNRQGALLLGGTFGARDLDVRNNTLIGRDMVRGASGAVNGVVNINNNSSARVTNRAFYFTDNILVSFIDAGVRVADPNNTIRYLVSGWNDNDAGVTRAAYLTFEGNVIYGRPMFGTAVESALPHTNLLGGNIRADASPLAGMNFSQGIDIGDFTRTAYANGAGADIERIKEAMESARLPLFDIAMADYRAFVQVLPAANEIMRHLSRPDVRGSLSNPLSLAQVERNVARYFEDQVRMMPVTDAVPAESPQRHHLTAGILNHAYGYEVHAASGYGGRLSVQQGFHSDNAYRGIISFGYGNEGDIDFTRIAAMGVGSPWTMGSVRGTPHPESRHPGVRFFVRIPYFNPVSGRTSYIVRNFHTPHWWRTLPEAAAILAITQEDIINAMRDNPARRFVCADTGCDTQNGSQNHPWRTVGHAVTLLWHGDTLYLRGTFNEDVTIPVSASGNLNNPTTLTPWAGHAAAINGDIHMNGADNITIRNIDMQGRTVFIGNTDSAAMAERSGLRNFQSNWWDLRCLGRDERDDTPVYGLGMLRNITVLNTNAAVIIVDENPFAPILGLRVE